MAHTFKEGDYCLVLEKQEAERLMEIAKLFKVKIDWPEIEEHENIILFFMGSLFSDRLTDWNTGNNNIRLNEISKLEFYDKCIGDYLTQEHLRLLANKEEVLRLSELSRACFFTLLTKQIALPSPMEKETKEQELKRKIQSIQEVIDKATNEKAALESKLELTKVDWHLVDETKVDVIIQLEEEHQDNAFDIIEYLAGNVDDGIEKEQSVEVPFDEYLEHYRERITRLFNPVYPKIGTPCWQILANGHCIKHQFGGNVSSIALYQSGNFYKTKEEAEQASKLGRHQLPKTDRYFN